MQYSQNYGLPVDKFTDFLISLQRFLQFSLDRPT